MRSAHALTCLLVVALLCAPLALSLNSVESRLGRTVVLSMAHERLEAAIADATAANDAQLVELLEKQRANYLLAEDVNAVLATTTGDAVARTAAVARAALRAQALALDPDAAAPTVGQHPTPSSAAFALADAAGMTVAAEDHAALARLDTLSPDKALALARLFDATAAYVLASRAAWEGRDTSTLTDVPPEVASVRLSQIALLDAALGARDAFALSPESACGETRVASVLALDLAGCDSTYAGTGTYVGDFVLLFDVGGADTYTNNDGGGHLVPGALVDVAGDDRHYGRDRAGTTGGGRDSSGFLLDLAGNDLYVAASTLGAKNGGGFRGDGALIDAAGDDRYSAGSPGVNGGSHYGVGLLVDGNGHDRYEGLTASNGGSWVGIAGLIDTGGNDVYAGALASNGGGGSTGRGALIDTDGNDLYGRTPGYETFSAFSKGFNGGGWDLGVGFLYDRGGNDVYAAGELGTNGGSYQAAVGTLLDETGVDKYTAASWGTNGSTSFLGGFALLLDGAGVGDTYADQQPNFNGSGTDRTVVPKGAGGAQIDRAA